MLTVARLERAVRLRHVLMVLGKGLLGAASCLGLLLLLLGVTIASILFLRWCDVAGSVSEHWRAAMLHLVIVLVDVLWA